MIRGCRFAVCAIIMGFNYYTAGEITPELHHKESQRLYKCFCRNQGTYIKMGQLVGQLDNVMPDQYVKSFEPMCMAAPKSKWKDVKAIIK